MERRWLSLLVENDAGILAKISGLFAGKAYNLDTLSVGCTEDSEVSRITISVIADDMVFEQIKKQLNRCVGIIKIIDMTNLDIINKELLFMKIKVYKEQDIQNIFNIVKTYGCKVIDINKTTLLIESLNNESINNKLINNLKSKGQLEVVRSGSVCIEQC